VNKILQENRPKITNNVLLPDSIDDRIELFNKVANSFGNPKSKAIYTIYIIDLLELKIKRDHT